MDTGQHRKSTQTAAAAVAAETGDPRVGIGTTNQVGAHGLKGCLSVVPHSKIKLL